MIIYRFEYKGVGVYQSRWDNDYIGEILDNYNCSTSPNTPSPSEDPMFKPHCNKVGETNFIFGFTSPQMLLNWFCAECVKELIDIWVTLNVIEIDENHVFASNKQCIFLKTAIMNKVEVNSSEEAKFHLNIK